MSNYTINNYYRELENIIHYGGTKKETSIRNAFYHLLNEYAKQKGLMIGDYIYLAWFDAYGNTKDGRGGCVIFYKQVTSTRLFLGSVLQFVL